MLRILIHSFLALIAGGMVLSSGLIKDPFHPGSAEIIFASRPEMNAPHWVTKFVRRFHEKNGRPPTKSEMETLAAEEFASDVRRMKLTWLHEVRWADGEPGGNVSPNEDKP